MRASFDPKRVLLLLLACAVTFGATAGDALAAKPWEKFDFPELGEIKIPDYERHVLANGMTVWDIADDEAMALGSRIGQLDFVSHCYLRPRHLPVWRYNLFAMVHGHSRDEVDAKAEQIASLLGNNCVANEVLFSAEILKKTGMRLAA